MWDPCWLPPAGSDGTRRGGSSARHDPGLPAFVASDTSVSTRASMCTPGFVKLPPHPGSLVVSIPHDLGNEDRNSRRGLCSRSQSGRDGEQAVSGSASFKIGHDATLEGHCPRSSLADDDLQRQLRYSPSTLVSSRMAVRLLSIRSDLQRAKQERRRN
jgi:hypothetical protein